VPTCEVVVVIPDHPVAYSRLYATAASLLTEFAEHAVPPSDQPTVSQAETQRRAELRRLVGDIRRESGRRFLREIAIDNLASGEARSRALRTRMGAASESVSAGWVTGISAACRRTDIAKPWDQRYEYNPAGEGEVIYVMDPLTARLITELLDEDGNLVA
jgi:hypothetical protein